MSYDTAYMGKQTNKQKRYKWTCIQKRNRPTDIENKLMVTYGESERRDKWGVWN